ncbi:DNA-binding transcriptional repressor PurR [Actinobacillus pleuropneumoniae]|nr:DNA-binding transcriptional repressor PurR [Actinobacillus pleuropneumoniae]
MTIDKYFDSLPLGAVVSDNWSGSYQAVSRLIELGHRKIAFLTAVSIESTSSVRDRYFGYCQALKDHGLPLDSRYIRLNMKGYREQVGVEQFYNELLDSYKTEGVTAVQTENDLIAANLLNLCLERGIRIPDDISIIGFDNNPVTEHVMIPLTTVEQNFYEIGRQAVRACRKLAGARETDTGQGADPRQAGGAGYDRSCSESEIGQVDMA